MDWLYPATGPLRRELYTKHLEFFRAGKEHRERLFMAGNRCGKTVAGAYELTLHLTGLYPDWWEGRRFDGAIDAWAAGETTRTVRDILQHELLGPSHARGTGMIPGDAILRVTPARGAAEAIDSVYVQHARGGVSLLGFKSYAEGRKNFQGTSKHVIWFDEEPDIAVYSEALIRTMKVPGTEEGGLMLVTFTPLQGYTDVVGSFLDASRDNAPVVSTY
jgi:phage terminase large subunit-like protein